MDRKTIFVAVTICFIASMITGIIIGTLVTEAEIEAELQRDTESSLDSLKNNFALVCDAIEENAEYFRYLSESIPPVSDSAFIPSCIIVKARLLHVANDYDRILACIESNSHY